MCPLKTRVNFAQERPNQKKRKGPLFFTKLPSRKLYWKEERERRGMDTEYQDRDNGVRGQGGVSGGHRPARKGWGLSSSIKTEIPREGGALEEKGGTQRDAPRLRQALRGGRGSGAKLWGKQTLVIDSA